MRIEGKISINATNLNAWYEIFGARSGAWNDLDFGIWLEYGKSGLYLSHKTNIHNKVDNLISMNIPFKISTNLGKYYINDNLAYDFNNEIYVNDNRPLYLFKVNDADDHPQAPMTLYYWKIWDDNNLLRDFVPCYRKSDGVIGLYDRVEGKFYTNKGTGTFLKGNDINNNNNGSTTQTSTNETLPNDYQKVDIAK